MSVFVPSYYDRFKCIADKCRHSCCIGWEIDIDHDTMEYYKCIKGELGNRLKKCISEEDTPHFVLGEDERCPFLNKYGLCDIILELGEDSLCEICAEHPRFRNFYSSREEIGIGLCCEETARIVLSESEPFSLKIIDNAGSDMLSDEEEFFFKIREHIFFVAQNRTISIKERFDTLCEEFGISLDDFSCERLVPIYKSLERLDDKWTGVLDNLSYSDLSFLESAELGLPVEQLFCYFIYRYFAESVFDGDMVSRVRFAMASCIVISALWECHKKQCGSVNLQDMTEYARMYSSEVEYSEENISTIFDII